MEVLNKLEARLVLEGYRCISKEAGRIWGKDEEDACALVEIILPSLPGQPEISSRDEDALLQKIENAVMIRNQKLVRALRIYLLSDIPSEKDIIRIKEYRNAWIIDQRDGMLFIYENQIADFYGLRKIFEDVLQETIKEDKEKKKNDLRTIVSPVNTGIVVINILVFILLSIVGDPGDPVFMAGHGALSWELVMEKGEFYRIVTSGFLHFGADHLIHNMLVLMVTGSRLERIEGKIDYLLVYFGSELAAAVTSLMVTLSSDTGAVSAGASGAVFGVIGALVFLIGREILNGNDRPFRKIGRSSVLFMIAFALVGGVVSPEIDTAAHVGGFLAGFAIMAIIRFVRRVPGTR